ncbi:MAG: toxin HipA [Rhodothermales bacterium]|nr:toxin HipA [Rhodothermales bacterium]
MRKALVRVQGEAAAVFEEAAAGYTMTYLAGYRGGPVSLTMPVTEEPYRFDSFPPFFDGLLPEGWQLDALLRTMKLDRRDYMGQLLSVGADTVGDVTVEEHP